MLAGLWLAAAGGCTSEKPDASPAQPPPVADEQPEPDPAPESVSQSDERDAEWAKLIAEAERALEQDDLEAVRKSIGSLEELANSEPAPGAEQLAALDELRAGLEEKTAAVAAKEREARLSEVPGLIETGRLDDAVAALDFAASRAPTDEERQQITDHRARIEEIRAAQRKLGAWMKLLGSETRSEVRAAQAELVAEPEAALPLLTASAQTPGDATLVKNSLEALRLLRRPSATLPAMVAVLESPEQEASWEDAAEAIKRCDAAGAGPELLDLARTSEIPAQREIALTTLSDVPDPPQETLLRLLPMMFSDGPELAAVLRCAAHSVRVNGQEDLLGLRGFVKPPTADELKLLTQLPARLESLMASEAEEQSEAARMARVLAIETRQVSPAPLADVSVFSVSAEYPENPKEAVLDGVWNSTDLATMWCYPVSADGILILDLGEERTVTAVKLWNLNQPGGQTRGWKQVEVFVSPTPTALQPDATGVVPMAPGAEETSDYGVIVSVPAVRGRYVKLKANELWNSSNFSGLAEVQVFGF